MNKHQREFPGSKYRAQYEEINVNPERKTPEKKLATAVLVRAIRDSVDLSAGEHPEERRYLYREVRAWLNADRISAFSFIWCCKVIGLCPNATRDAIKRVQNDPKILDNVKIMYGVNSKFNRRMAA